MYTNISDEEDLKFEVATKGVTYSVDPSTPFGFYTISVSKGMVPKDLQGSFTLSQIALNKINQYIAKTKKEVI